MAKLSFTNSETREMLRSFGSSVNDAWQESAKMIHWQHSVKSLSLQSHSLVPAAVALPAGSGRTVQCLQHAQQRRKLCSKPFQASLCLVLFHNACIALIMIVLLSLARTLLPTNGCTDQRHSIERCALVPTSGICNVWVCAVLIGFACLSLKASACPG